MAVSHDFRSALVQVQDIVKDVPAWKLCVYATLLFPLYAITMGIYNIFFHPLRNFPGPKKAALSNIWYSYVWLSGRYPHTMHALHEKYGSVVRVAPNQLSFNSSTSWKDIYASRGHQIFRKSGFYAPDKQDPETNMLRESDPIKHGQIRKMFSHAFSAKSLMEQEPIVQENIDLFIEQIGKHGTGKDGLDMVKWYNYCSFDIIGDLAFGESFNATKEGKTHFWISLILDSIYAASFIDVIRRFPWLNKLIPSIVPADAAERRERHLNYCRDKVNLRINSDNKRKDFLTNVLDNYRDQISDEELSSNVQFLIVAGSETTATTLSGLTYYLLRNPHTYQRLVSEITSAFTSYSQITSITARKLQYLGAVIDEVLRVYPPVPIGLPRYSPGETVDGYFIPKGVEVSTSSWAAGHDPKNFHEPWTFKPERWLDGECKEKDIREASQPFSLGPRVCLGRNLAIMELRLIICKMLYTYHMELLDSKLDWERDSPAYVLWVKPDLRVRLHKR
ncbi:cytochrome P450 [Choiromyces venosus 120613-1]|uniref:Cytochrome P450 n=1 Tax=Choiromyces venosus 120613-1 TaxID=1336337 RepID=A0A3N4JYA6_9PEZI|nr:cytochrome P450 [Choiromyces venosus 120613-1]